LDFTVFGSDVLFAGRDTSGDYNLWITNGTQAGTSELNVAGAYSGAVLYYAAYANPDFTVFGSEVLFDGFDASEHLSLWVTNGTAAGTSEVQVAQAYSAGLFYNAANPDFTIIGGKALFAGFDKNGYDNLWVTNGTTAGTSELTSSSAYSYRLFYYQVNPNITVLNNSEGVFEGNHVLGNRSPWVTNGTSAGTSEPMVMSADHRQFY